MRRGNFLEAAKGGALGFQEGYVRIDRSYATVYQYPPNRMTNQQSDPFTALVWEVTRLNSDWSEKADDETPDEPIVIRMGNLDQMRPGQLAAKDFDNLDALPEDIGDAVGVVGNSFLVDDTARFSQAWNRMETSLEKVAFKKEILGRCIAADFDGMVCHLKTEAEKYIARRDSARAKKGEEATATYLVCDRIHVYPYDRPKTAAKAATKPAAGVNGGVPDNGLDAAKAVFGKLSPEFKKAVADKEMPRLDFQKVLTSELIRQRLNPKTQKLVMDTVKNDEALVELATELGVFTVDDAGAPTTVTFA